MTKALDVAVYIHELNPAVDKLKMQKLLYYVQGWHLGRLGVPAFEDRIEAWQYGPVTTTVYVDNKRPDPWLDQDVSAAKNRLPDEVKTTAEAATRFFDRYTSAAMVSRTHLENPWRKAYEQGENTEITHSAIKDYFGNSKNFILDGDTLDKNLEYVIMTQAGVLKRMWKFLNLNLGWKRYVR